MAAAGAGAVVPLDAGRVADALVTYLSEPAVRRQAGQAGRRLVEERFTWPQVAARSLELYRSVRPSAAAARS